MLYSIVPPELVMGNMADRSTDAPVYVEIEYMGERVQAMPLEDRGYVINRIISTSPKAYLNPGLQPGTVIGGIKPGLKNGIGYGKYY